MKTVVQKLIETLDKCDVLMPREEWSDEDRKALGETLWKVIESDPASLRLETRSVLAGAYKGGRAKLNKLLTHTALVGVDGVISTICKTVALDSLADEYAGDTTAPPSCDRCRTKDPRFKEQA